MEYLISIPWYIYLLIGALLGVITGKVFKDNVGNYIGWTFVGSVVVILAGTAWVFMASMNTSYSSREIGDIYFSLLGDYVILYVANIISTWLFSK